MKVLVPVKRVIDANVNVRVNKDNTDVIKDNVKMAINPFCEIALEEAVRLKERGVATEVVVVTIGSLEAEDVLRTSFATGADRCVLLNSETDLEPLSVSKLLKKVVEHEKPELVILGKQAIDGDNNQTGQMLSAMLGCAHATYVSKIEKVADGFEITREIDGGTEDLLLSSPAIITTDLRLNEPRYASLPNIMKAKKMTIESATSEQMGHEEISKIKVISVNEPEKRAGGVKVSSVAELVEKLKNEAEVI